MPTALTILNSSDEGTSRLQSHPWILCSFRRLSYPPGHLAIRDFLESELLHDLERSQIRGLDLCHQKAVRLFCDQLHHFSPVSLSAMLRCYRPAQLSVGINPAGSECYARLFGHVEPNRFAG